MKVALGRAGLIGFSWGSRGRWNLHLFVHPEFWAWGYREDWHDGPLPEFGLGALFLFCWHVRD